MIILSIVVISANSTLLIMVAAFAGHELLFKAYKTAVNEKYRFGPYGDAMLITVLYPHQSYSGVAFIYYVVKTNFTLVQTGVYLL